MKVINKDQLIQLIQDMEIETVRIEEPLNTIDASYPDKREHFFNRTGEVIITLKGRVSDPDNQL